MRDARHPYSDLLRKEFDASFTIETLDGETYQMERNAHGHAKGHIWRVGVVATDDDGRRQAIGWAIEGADYGIWADGEVTYLGGYTVDELAAIAAESSDPDAKTPH